MMSALIPAWSHAEQLARAAEAGGDLVGDQQQPVAVADLPKGPQVGRVVEPHPAGALDDRLQDHRPHRRVARQPIDLLQVGLVDRRRVARRRHRREDLLGDRAGEDVVHPVDRVADRHAAERVAVVAAPDRQQPPLPGRLDGHLDRHLDRDAARVGQEDLLVAGHRGQPLGQQDRRLVGEPAEHHVGHPAELVGDRGVDLRHPVAVDGRPPRRHAVEDLTPVGQRQVDPVGALHHVGGHGGRDSGVGMPDVSAVELGQVGHCSAAHSSRRARATSLPIMPSSIRRSSRNL